jgi:RNA-directed DNA polymerase
MPMLAQLTSDDVLDTAYEWLCRRRRDYSANADLWWLRRCYPHEKEKVKDELVSGCYRFSLLSRVTLKNGGRNRSLVGARCSQGVGSP